MVSLKKTKEHRTEFVMAAEAALESKSNSVTGLNYVHVPDTAICSHPLICNRHGLVH